MACTPLYDESVPQIDFELVADSVKALLAEGEKYVRSLIAGDTVVTFSDVVIHLQGGGQFFGGFTFAISPPG